MLNLGLNLSALGLLRRLGPAAIVLSDGLSILLKADGSSKILKAS